MSAIAILVPTFALVVTGFLLRRHAGFSQAFWSDLERLIYYVLFPALLFGALARRPLELDVAATLVYTGAIFMLAGIVLGYLARWLFRVSRVSFASAFQCAFRFNSYIGFAILGGLHGADGVAVFAILAGFMVPVANLASVWMLAHYGDGGLMRELLRNPLILSTFTGLLWSAMGWPLPQMVDTTLGFLGEAALPLGLIAVGAGLRIAATAAQVGLVAYMTLVKLMLLPAVAWVVASWFQLEGPYFAAALVLAALPTASSAYILAARMGGDGQLVASITAMNMLAAVLTLPLWLAALAA